MNGTRGFLPRRVAILLLATVAISAIWAALPVTAQAATLYVDIDRGTPGGTGSFVRPYQFITDALAVAIPGDVVQVSADEYSPADGETLPLVIPKGVTLQGDTSSHIAIPALVGSVISGDDTTRLIEIYGGDEDTVVDGFILTENSSPLAGSAIYIQGGRAPGGGPTISDCFFITLDAPTGGAIYVQKTGAYTTCVPRISRSWFYACRASAASSLGGAIRSIDGSLRIDDVFFFACSSTGDGGAISASGSGSSLVTDSMFLGCNADVRGGGVMAVNHSFGVFDTHFYQNGAVDGGGVYFWDSVPPNDKALGVLSSVFDSNAAVSHGSAVRIYGGLGMLNSLTVVNNQTSPAIEEMGSVTQVQNSILWDNSDDLSQGTGTLTPSYSCIQDGDFGTGVIHSDPRLDPNGTYRLLPNSPCIDTASDALAPADDLEGTARPADGDGDGVAQADMGAIERDPKVDRAAGDNRYETAIAASQEHFDRADTVVLATGSDYPDALCASPLAGLFGSPVLLTPTNSLPDSLVDELERLQAEKVYIIGGTGAVSETVEVALGDLGLEIERLWGLDRYSTSEAVVSEIAILLEWAATQDFILARGDAFPDALSASPFAYNNIVPILLTRPTSLPQPTADAIGNLGFTNAIIMGGTGAVSDAVEDQVVAQMTGTSERIAGANRYETSAEFADWVQSHTLWDDTYDEEFAGVAVGSNFPDALCGGAVCGRKSGPLLLTPAGALPDGAGDYINIYSNTMAHVQVFGGSGVVSEDVLDDVRALIP